MATSVPAPQSNPPNPQVSSSSASTAVNVSAGTFAARDPAGARAYEQYRVQAERELTEKYIAEGDSPGLARQQAVIEAKLAANQQFAPQIAAAGAGTLTQTTTPLLAQQPSPPGGPVTPVTPAANPQVPAAAPTPPPGRPLLPITDDGGSFNRQIGDVRADGAVLTQFLSGGIPVFVIRPAVTTAPPVTPASNPQVIGERTTVRETFDARIFGERDPAGFREYINYQNASRRALEDKYRAEEAARLPAGAIIDGETADQIRLVAAQQAEDAARQRFAPQIIAAGAGTSQTTTTPLLAQQPQPPTSPTNTAPVSPAVNPQVPAAAAPAAAPAVTTPAALPNDVDPNFITQPEVATIPSPGQADQDLANQTFANRENAKLQATIQAQRKQANDGDWRVKLRLAAGANYLYKATEPGILEPLSVSDGVVFPYTPKINTTYSATYSATDLTHSNYKGYFYQGSSVGDVKISATFTAQDTFEANYLLAVIHFFRSVTKMFYGQDQQYRGAPPPLVFLQGLGEYQFNLHPCVVSQFDYVLPDDVDYIRARSVSVNGTNLLQKRDRQTVSNGSDSTSAGRLQGAGLSAGGIFIPPPPPTLGIDKPTYVPTKMEMSITLLPIQTRAQLSQEFSLAKFANGNLVKGGYW